MRHSWPFQTVFLVLDHVARCRNGLMAGFADAGRALVARSKHNGASPSIAVASTTFAAAVQKALKRR
jgi:hypothetical protein